jgi:hypothetical protein
VKLSNTMTIFNYVKKGILHSGTKVVDNFYRHTLWTDPSPSIGSLWLA